MSKYALALHAHFYQPPRLDHTTKRIGTERGAAPYRNWNERAAEEIYRPNARLGNFSTLSLDMNPEIGRWLGQHDPTTQQQISSAIRGAQNAMAVPYFQAPLTTLSPRDRAVMLAWGAHSAQQQFGTRPLGVFLPAFAADQDVLQSVQEAGFEFILLRPAQLDHIPAYHMGRVKMSVASGGSLTAFVINEALSASLMTEMVERGGAGYWAHRYLAAHTRQAASTTVLYVEGDWLGQHRMCEADFIHYLLTSEAKSVGFRPTTLARAYSSNTDHAPEVELAELSLDPLSEPQRSLAISLTALMHEADPLLETLKGNWNWLLEPATLAQLESPHDPALQIYLHLRQAWANCQQLERYPQLSVEHILTDAAYALRLILELTGADLHRVFSAPLLPHLRQHFEGTNNQVSPASVTVGS